MAFLSQSWTKARDTGAVVAAWTRAHKAWTVVIVVAVLGGGYLAYAHATGSNAGSEYVIGRVTRGDLTVTVEGSGQVTANQELDLAPKSSGTVTGVYVKAGDEVSAGQTLVTIDDTDAEKTVRDAYESLESAQISYQQAVANADTSTASAAGNAFDASASAMSDLPGILHDLDNELHNLSVVPGHTDQEGEDAYAALMGGEAGETAAATSDADYEDALSAYQSALALSATVSRTSSASEIDTFIGAVYKAAVAASKAANDTHTLMQNADNKLIDGDTTIPTAFTTSLTQSATDASKANTDAGNVYSAKTSFDTATATVSGTNTSIALESAELSLQKAQESYQDAQDDLANYVVAAPFSGTIAKVDVQTNDQSSDAVATLITNETYADLSLNEVDAAKVKVGQKATVTFDAIDGLTLMGTVAEVDSVGTVSQGVVTYDVKISFDSQDNRVKPGMTVDATITTDSAQNVLIVPSSAVTTVGNQSFVEVVTEGAPAATSTASSTYRGRNASSTGAYASSTLRVRTGTTTASSSGAFAGGFARSGTGATETVPVSSVTVTRVPVVVGLASDTETEIVSGLEEGAAIVERTTSGTTAVTTGTSGFGAARGNATFIGGGAGAARAVNVKGG